MKNLFDKWKTKVPKYSEVHKDLFNSLSQNLVLKVKKRLILENILVQIMNYIFMHSF
jgi:hypothetical protein